MGYNDQRAPDPALSDNGRQQVRQLPEHPALAALVRSRRAVDIYSSPLQRAIETAAPLHQVFESPIRLRPDLAEIGGMHSSADEKTLRGKSPSELSKHYPQL